MPHVVGVAVAVLGVVATTDVIAEVGVVQTRGADQPVHYLVNLLVAPLATLSCPPAERHAPAVEMLAHHLRGNHVAEGVGGRCLPDVVAEVPLVLHVRPALVGKHFLVGVVAVGAQVFAVGLAAQLHILPHALLDSPFGLVARGAGNELRVPLSGERQVFLLPCHLDGVVALFRGSHRHLLGAGFGGGLYPSAIVGAAL